MEKRSGVHSSCSSRTCESRLVPRPGQMVMTGTRIFPQVPRLLFGSGVVSRLNELLPPVGGGRLFVVDSVLEAQNVVDRLPIDDGDEVEWFPASEHEPSTDQVDQLRDRIAGRTGGLPTAVVGVGGGSTMDVAKAVSVMLNNEGTSSQYQGWDLLRRPGVFKVGVPTLSGSGAEASRTAVLLGPEKKFGINSDHSMFNAVVLDSSLISGVPADQRFHSGMDCFIHCVESLQGSMINELSKSFASQGLELCTRVFLDGGSDDELMTASYMGGVSIVNSEVGICHALSYGLSMELGYRHGFANCVAFNVLDEFYGEWVDRFQEMLRIHQVSLPEGVCRSLDAEAVNRMVAMTLRMERPLANALGPQWHDLLTPDRIVELYERM